jgi:hypothetical protein
METQNLTLRVPKALLQKAKQAAATRGTTVTSLVIEGLTRATSANPEYEAAWQRQQAMMGAAQPRRAADESWLTRDQTHER